MHNSIIIEGQTDPRGSYGRVNLYLADALRRKGVEVQVRSFDQDQNQLDATLPTLSLEPFATSMSEPSIIIRQTFPPNFTNRSKSTPLIVVQPWEIGSVPYEYKVALETVDAIWVPSRWSKQSWVTAGAHPSKIFIIPNGIPSSQVNTTERTFDSSSQLHILFVGGPIARKGIDLAFSALNLLPDTQLQQCTLTIKSIGHDTYYRGQDRTTDLLKHYPRVAARSTVITTYLNEAEMTSLYDSADVLLHPYFAEGFGMPVLEAMSRGTVPIVTAGGSTDDFCDISNSIPIDSTLELTSAPLNSTGFSGGPQYHLRPDIESIAHHLSELIEERQKLQELSNQAIRTAKQMTWDSVALAGMKALSNITAGSQDIFTLALELAGIPPSNSSNTYSLLSSLITLKDVHSAELVIATSSNSAEQSNLLCQMSSLAKEMPDIWTNSLHRQYLEEQLGYTTSDVENYLRPQLDPSSIRELLTSAALESQHIQYHGSQSTLKALRSAGLKCHEVNQIHTVAVSDLDNYQCVIVELGDQRPLLNQEVIRMLIANAELPCNIIIITENQTHQDYAGAFINSLKTNPISGIRLAAITTSTPTLNPLYIYMLTFNRITPAKQNDNPLIHVASNNSPTTGFDQDLRTLSHELSLHGKLSASSIPIAPMPRDSDVSVFFMPLNHLPFSTYNIRGARVLRTTVEVVKPNAKFIGYAGTFDQIWCMSKFDHQQFLSEGIPEEKLYIIPCSAPASVSPERITEFRTTNMRRKRFLSVFNFEQRKNPVALLMAYSQLWSRHRDATLTIKLSGNITSNQFFRWAATLPDLDLNCLSSLTIITNTLSRQAMNKLYLEHDIFVLPSHGEGFGLPFLEALSFGMIVIAPSWGGQLDFLNPENSYLCPGELVDVHLTDVELFRNSLWFEVDIPTLASIMESAILDGGYLDKVANGLASAEEMAQTDYGRLLKPALHAIGFSPSVP
ncbi:glycosyltransferase [Ferrimicrobium sp.]|uniref:glycosyltransferase family 4 protein n=1 Tax=Ferrimicrobium sp. TaxID=2926050 RepID=UPI002613371C|nr:glycosyltransferase [Ferrimicrobium sp.]